MDTEGNVFVTFFIVNDSSTVDVYNRVKNRNIRSLPTEKRAKISRVKGQVFPNTDQSQNLFSFFFFLQQDT